MHGFDLLRSICYDGYAECPEKLPTALQQVIQRRLYVSPTMLPSVVHQIEPISNRKRAKNITLDALTDKEEMVISVIGDGSDDQQAAERLGLSPDTVNTHRKAIMAKLKLPRKEQLMRYAVLQGYIWVTAQHVH